MNILERIFSIHLLALLSGKNQQFKKLFKKMQGFQKASSL